MFIKSFRVKSSSQIKNSERKKLRAEIKLRFPTLTEEDVQGLIPLKEEMQSAKIATHSGTHVLVYYKDKTPTFFEVYKVIYPTVYTLWMFPNILHKFYTTPNVLEKFLSGADLMLPGVVLNTDNIGPHSFGDLKKNDLCAICLVGNDAPIAVGRTTMSSRDMFDSGKRGKGMCIEHVYMDQLWASGDGSHPPMLKSDGVEMVPRSEEDSVTEATQSDLKDLSIEDGALVIEKEDMSAIEPKEERSPVELMDELLLNSFLCALKTTAKKMELPILTSTFYRQHVQACCSDDAKLDIKKTSYKKLSKFLKEMEAKEVLKIKELSKGVESITELNFNHVLIQRFKVVKNNEKVMETPEENKLTYHPPEIKELYFVTGQVLPIFKDFGFGKGSSLEATGVRKVITDYVKNNELQDENNKRLVKLDAHLTDCTLNKDEYHLISMLQWEDLNSRLIRKMQIGFQLCFPGEKPISKKGKLEPIDISVAQRSGNKKVTLINNLEMYGINPSELAHKIQIGVAASTSVNPSPPNRKDGSQVLTQGNQVKFVGKLLLDEYKIPKRLIKGLELASKKKPR